MKIIEIRKVKPGHFDYCNEIDAKGTYKIYVRGKLATILKYFIG